MEQELVLSYFQAVRQINENDEKTIKIFRKHACATDPVAGVEVIKQQLQCIGQTLADRKEQLFLDYGNDQGISDEDWDCYREARHKWNLYVAKYNNHFAFPYIIHDNRIPADFMIMLKKNLMRNGINPDKVHLISVEHCDFNTAKFRFGDEVEFGIEIVPAHIGVNTQFIENFSQEAQEGLCGLLAYNVKGDMFSGFSSEAYALSLLTLALKNEHNHAQLLKKVCNELYNSVFSIEDYQTLSDICHLHATWAWLEKYAV
jgi:hypothetical protein